MRSRASKLAHIDMRWTTIFFLCTDLIEILFRREHQAEDIHTDAGTKVESISLYKSSKMVIRATQDRLGSASRVEDLEKTPQTNSTEASGENCNGLSLPPSSYQAADPLIAHHENATKQPILAKTSTSQARLEAGSINTVSPTRPANGGVAGCESGKCTWMKPWRRRLILFAVLCQLIAAVSLLMRYAGRA